MEVGRIIGGLIFCCVLFLFSTNALVCAVTLLPRQLENYIYFVSVFIYYINCNMLVNKMVFLLDPRFSGCSTVKV